MPQSQIAQENHPRGSNSGLRPVRQEVPTRRHPDESHQLCSPGHQEVCLRALRQEVFAEGSTQISLSGDARGCQEVSVPHLRQAV